MSYTPLWEVRMRPQGSPAELERRRVRAIELLQRDVPVHAVAERLGVDRRSVRRWKPAYRRGGRAGLEARPAAGRPPKLAPAPRRPLAHPGVARPGTAGDPPRLPARSPVRAGGRAPLVRRLRAPR